MDLLPTKDLKQEQNPHIRHLQKNYKLLLLPLPSYQSSAENTNKKADMQHQFLGKSAYFNGIITSVTNLFGLPAKSIPGPLI